MARTKQTAPKKSSKKKVVDEKPVDEKPVVEKPVVEKPVVEKPVDEKPVDEKPVDEKPVDDLSTEVSITPYLDEFTAVISELDSALNTIRTLKQRLQKLEKVVHRDHKANMKRVNGRRRRVQDPANPSGFATPGPVSDELRKFLSLGKDDLIARTSVTKAINAYCKAHDLQQKEDRRQIQPDKALRTLLKMGPKDELTFFNLQTYMKVHFPNKEGVYPTA